MNKDKIIPMFNEVVIYEWPWAQNCSDCIHSEPVDLATFNPGCCICLLGCRKNDGKTCPKKE